MAKDGQVCFHRRLFANPIKPQRCTTEPVRPLDGINKDVAGVEEAVSHWSGKSFKHGHSYMCGKQGYLQDLENLVYRCTSPIVQSTISMQSILMLGVSGGMPPRKFLKNTCSEIEFGSISGS